MARQDMKMKSSFALIIKCIVLIAIIATAQGIVNQKVIRVFDMNGPNVKQVTSIEFTNESSGGNQDAEVPYYIALVRSVYLDNLIYIEAKLSDSVLNVTRSKADDTQDGEYAAFRVNFSTPIKKQDKLVKISIIEEYLNRKVAFPKKMKITDDPKIMVIDDAYYLSLYDTKKMKSTFEIGDSATLISATELESGEVRGRSIRYGTYKDIAALSSHPVFIQMNYNDPLPVFTSVTRTAFISHWKRINIDEEFRLVNKIADLDGEFGRIDFNPYRVKYSLNNLDCELPQTTEDLYYVDEIGNVTSSHAHRTKKHVKASFEPRFPIMGGWKTYWKQGYTLPLWDYVAQLSEPDTYKFDINFSHPYNDIVAENLTLKIVLPEGAVVDNVSLDLPFEMDSITTETVYQYLDLRGRTTIVMSKKNILEKHHDQIVSVTYKLSAFNIYLKPALVCFYTFLLVFFLLISYRISSLSSSKVKKE